MTVINEKLLDIIFNDYTHENKLDFVPLIDIVETDDNFNIYLSLAGFKREDITLKVEQNNLFIEGENKRDKTMKYNLKQIKYGKFNKMYTLPKDVNYDNIIAQMENGILHIEIPKDKLELKKRLIEIS